MPAVKKWLQVDAIYWSSDGIKLIDTQEATWIASIEDQGYEANGYIAGSDKNRDKPDEDMA